MRKDFGQKISVSMKTSLSERKVRLKKPPAWIGLQMRFFRHPRFALFFHSLFIIYMEQRERVYSIIDSNITNNDKINKWGYDLRNFYQRCSNLVNLITSFKCLYFGEAIKSNVNLSLKPVASYCWLSNPFQVTLKFVSFRLWREKFQRFCLVGFASAKVSAYFQINATSCLATCKSCAVGCWFNLCSIYNSRDFSVACKC